MAADPDIAAVIDRIVARARVSGRRRDDLRRELWTHFEESAGDDGGEAAALARFGSVDAVADALGRIHRPSCLRYLTHVAVGAGLAVAAALAIELAINVRVGSTAGVFRVAPAFSRGIGTAIAVVLGLVVAREAAKRRLHLERVALAAVAGAAVCAAALVFAASLAPIAAPSALVATGLVCGRIDGWAARAATQAIAFAAILYVDHLALSVNLGAARAFWAGLTLAAIWSSTLVILRHADRLLDSTPPYA